MSETIFMVMLYESAVLIITSILTSLVLLKYFQKHHVLTLYLFVVFFFFTTAIFFSWFSKILVIYSDFNYIKDVNKPSDPGTLEAWFVLRIVDFRFAFLFTSVAIFFTYLFKVKIFHDEYNKWHRIIVIIYGIWTIFYSLFIYQAGSTLSMVFAFFFPFLYMCMIYFPFMNCSLRSYKSCIEDKDKAYRTAFFSLSIMAFCFVMIYGFFLIDRILQLFGFSRWTIFYYLAWASELIGILGAYLGYVRPKSREEQI